MTSKFQQPSSSSESIGRGVIPRRIGRIQRTECHFVSFAWAGETRGLQSPSPADAAIWRGRCLGAVAWVLLVRAHFQLSIPRPPGPIPRTAAADMFAFCRHFADRRCPTGAPAQRAVAVQLDGGRSRTPSHAGRGACTRWIAALLLISVAGLVGCSRDPVGFNQNEVFAATIEHDSGQPMEAALGDVEAILVELFGTPDDPRLPELRSESDSLSELVDIRRLARATGPVASDREGKHSGLYRKHCSVCHGITGDGLGPAAALQNPYPRDYRNGVFKYKSTPRGARPTRQDLARIIVDGLPGTSMPAFGLLPEEDLEAIIDYVIYLSIRGELERRLLIAAGSEFDYSDGGRGDSDHLIRPAEQGFYREAYAAQREWIESEIGDIVRRWLAAPSRVPAVDDMESPLVGDSDLAREPGAALGQEPGAAVLASAPVDETSWEESVRIGRELFRGQVANCASCHGEDGAGGALPLDYDDWTKEWTTRLGIDPRDHEKLKPFRAAGALEPRPLQPRNLTLGGFRGGESPRDIYSRILHGIDGTPMPAINRVESESETGLTDEQIWHLVRYVLSLTEQSTAMGAVQ